MKSNKMKIDRLTTLLIISTLSLTKFSRAGAQPDITTDYIVEYPDDYCSSAPDPDPVTVTVPVKSRALIVMQEAATLNSDVRFSTTYFGSELGYFIDKLNGTNSDLENSCFWFIYIRNSKGIEFLSPLGVSNFVIPSNGYSIIWRYQQYIPENSTHSNDTEPLVDLPIEVEPTETIMVNYSIEYTDIETCGQGLELIPPPLVETEIALLGSAQSVMEKSVENGREYRFSLSFFNNELGYFVDAINGTSSNVTAGCFWFFYVRLPNGTEIQPNVGITNYPIPSDGHSVIMRFESTEHVEVEQLVTTHYSVEFKDEQCGIEIGSGPDPVSVEVPIYSNGLRVMEAAADISPEYMFTAIYLSPYGYLITNISGVAADVPRQCFWFYYIIYPTDPNTELLSAILLSNFNIPGPGYSIIWRFSKDLTAKANFTTPMVDVPPTAPVPTIIVDYLIEYEDKETCGHGLLPSDTLEISIPTSGSVLQVMENAADLDDSYRFKVTYFTDLHGYAIDGINVTENNADTNCSWYYIIGRPDGTQENPQVPISKYYIPSEGYTVIIRFQDNDSPLILESGAKKLEMILIYIQLSMALLVISLL